MNWTAIAALAGISLVMVGVMWRRLSESEQPSPQHRRAQNLGLVLLSLLALGVLYAAQRDAVDGLPPLLPPTEPFDASPAPAAQDTPMATPRPVAPEPDLVEPPVDDEETIEEKRTQIRLFGTAKVRAIYDNEELRELRIEGVQPGSFWDMVGFQDGDAILEVDGRLVDSPETSVAFMNALTRSDVLIVRVRREDGSEQTLEYRTPREP